MQGRCARADRMDPARSKPAARMMAAVLAAMLLIAQTVAASAQSSARSPRVYRNPEYGFVVRIPTILQIDVPPAPAPAHGFDLHVAPDADGWVFAAYEALDAHTLAVEADSTVAMRAQQGCRVLQRKSGTLGGAAAEDLTFRCAPKSAGGHATIEHTVMALRDPPHRGLITYNVGVRYAEGSATRAEAERVLRTLLDGFVFTSLDP